MKKIKNIIWFILTFIVLIIVYKNLFFLSLIFPTAFDMVESENNLYIEKTISGEEKREIKKVFLESKKRIIKRRGGFNATPKIIIIDSEEKSKFFKIAGYPGKTHFSFFGTYIILRHNKGDNIDVMAHELMHAELIYKIGYFNRNFKIPVWFDEGFAMQVDDREKYIINPEIYKEEEINGVKNKNTVSKFWSGGDKKIIENYSFSKYLVKEIIDDIGADNIYKYLERVKSGEDFETVFKF